MPSPLLFVLGVVVTAIAVLACLLVAQGEAERLRRHEEKLRARNAGEK